MSRIIFHVLLSILIASYSREVVVSTRQQRMMAKCDQGGRIKADDSSDNDARKPSRSGVEEFVVLAAMESLVQSRSSGDGHFVKAGGHVRCFTQAIQINGEPV